MSRPPRLLFMTFSNDPGSDRIVAAMGRLGAQCAVAGSPGAFAARSRFVKAFFPIRRFGRLLPQGLVVGPRFDEITRAWRPDLVVPLDELAARVLRDGRLYHKANPDVQRLIERSLGAPAAFETVCSRQRLIETARECGVRAPPQQPALNLRAAKSAAAALGYPIVLKREQTCGGAGVAIAADAASLTRAFRRARLKAAAKRLTRWMPGFQMSERTPLSLQQFVQGALAFRVVACADGDVLDGVSFLAEGRDATETRGSTILRQIEQVEMREATKTLVAALGCSGFVAFDFIVASDDKAYLIEMNARPIACGHLGRPYGHDIYGAMFDNLCQTPHAPAIPIDPPQTIALFPNELDRDPESPLLDGRADVFHDVPWDDPGVVNAYAAWLEQRHPAQRPHLRHRFRIERERAAPHRTELSAPGYPP